LVIGWSKEKFLTLIEKVTKLLSVYKLIEQAGKLWAQKLGA
jgi:hypothetical protein